MSIAFGLAWRITWAITATTYQMLACSAAGHPKARWTDGTRRCNCGRTWGV
jgi:hypothetical protein